eukprot:scaffold74564_cov56-Cyclotella_meneghiniana.AAC.1
MDRAYMDTSRTSAPRQGIPLHDCIMSPVTIVPTNIPPPVSEPRHSVHPGDSKESFKNLNNAKCQYKE